MAADRQFVVSWRGGAAPAGGSAGFGDEAPGSRNVIRVPPDGDAAGLDGAGVPLGDLGDDREAEAGAGHGAGVVGAVEALEDVGQVRLGDAGALVVDGDHAVVQGDASRCPTGGLHLAALSSRLVSARSRAAASPSTYHGSAATTNDSDGARRRTRATAWSSTSCSSTVPITAGTGSSRASSTRSPTRVVSSSSWARTSVEQLGPGVVGQ